MSEGPANDQELLVNFWTLLNEEPNRSLPVSMVMSRPLGLGPLPSASYPLPVRRLYHTVLLSTLETSQRTFPLKTQTHGGMGLRRLCYGM